MIDYSLSQLIDGPSLPGGLLIGLPLVLLWAWISGRRGMLYVFLGLFLILSLPVTGKLLLYPLEIGVLVGGMKGDNDDKEIDAVAVISNGLQRDLELDLAVLSSSSLFRVKQAEALAERYKVPLLISGTMDPFFPEKEQELLNDLFKGREDVAIAAKAHGTLAHVDNIANLAKGHKARRLVLFVSGIHALRTRAVLSSRQLEVPFVVVGVIDSTFSWMDFVPSFNGFFHVKHALKEYAGLVAYLYKGQIKFKDV
ncbi:MAG: hypothetical protein MI743_18690 [Sneathiellales bacterium]|nr:hypothetical protein [Sneathiellales bacterium]